MAVKEFQMDESVIKYQFSPGGKETLVIVFGGEFLSHSDISSSIAEVAASLKSTDKISAFGTVFSIKNAPSDGPLLKVLADNLYEALNKVQGVRFAYVVGVGSGCLLAQQLAISHTRFVRRLALFDPSSRALEPGTKDRVIEFLESRIPCGLPLRKGGTQFDSRSEIHRVHCPSLVCTSPESDNFITEEADFLAARMPNAWRGHFSIYDLCRPDSFYSLLSILADFLETPAKAPQKNIQRVGVSSSC